MQRKHLLKTAELISFKICKLLLNIMQFTPELLLLIVVFKTKEIQKTMSLGYEYKMLCCIY